MSFIDRNMYQAFLIDILCIKDCPNSIFRLGEVFAQCEKQGIYSPYLIVRAYLEC